MSLTKSDILERITKLADDLQAVDEALENWDLNDEVKANLTRTLDGLNNLEHDLEQEIHG